MLVKVVPFGCLVTLLWLVGYEQFILFPQCFQKACFPGASKGVILWEWVNIFGPDTFTTQVNLVFALQMAFIETNDIYYFLFCLL